MKMSFARIFNPMIIKSSSTFNTTSNSNVAIRIFWNNISCTNMINFITDIFLLEYSRFSEVAAVGVVNKSSGTAKKFRV